MSIHDTTLVKEDLTKEHTFQTSKLFPQSARKAKEVDKRNILFGLTYTFHISIHTNPQPGVRIVALVACGKISRLSEQS
jgi:hypothetical protein